MYIGTHLSITDTHAKSVKCLAFECRGDKSILGSWDDKLMTRLVRTLGDNRSPLKEFWKQRDYI